MAERLHFLFRWEKLGRHVHVGVWAGTEQQAKSGARPKLGTLTMDPEDWSQFQQLVGLDLGERPFVEFRKQEEQARG